MMTQRPRIGSLRSSEVNLSPQNLPTSTSIYLSPRELSSPAGSRDAPGVAASIGGRNSQVHLFQGQLLPGMAQPDLETGPPPRHPADLFRGDRKLQDLPRRHPGL